MQLLCSSVLLSTFKFPACRVSCPAFKIPFPHLFLFQSFGHRRNFSFPQRNNPDLFVCFLFSSANLLEAVLTAVRACWCLFCLWVTCSRSDHSVTTHVLYGSAGCSAEISYTCGIATGQMPRPYALSPHLDAAGNLRVSLLFRLSLGDVLAKHCLGPCDIFLHLLLQCWRLAQCKTTWRFPWIAVPFWQARFIIWKKPTLLVLVLTVWGLIAYANMQNTI